MTEGTEPVGIGGDMAEEEVLVGRTGREVDKLGGNLDLL